MRLTPRFEKIVPRSVTAITHEAKKLSPSLKPNYRINSLEYESL